jgi:CBS-domain-containing membrane protein
MAGHAAAPVSEIPARLLDSLLDVCPAHAISVAGQAGAAAIALPAHAAAPAMPPALAAYFAKMLGGGVCPPAADVQDIAWSWLGSFLGIAAVAFVNFNLLGGTDLLLLIGSFGASAVLIYGAIKSPLAQPRNLLGGHVISALIGVAAWQLLGPVPWLAAAVAVSTAIAAMHATRTLHPPGGATALIAVIGSGKVHALGYMYAFVPVGLGAVIMLAIALAVNNIPQGRRYPDFWF